MELRLHAAAEHSYQRRVLVVAAAAVLAISVAATALSVGHVGTSGSGRLAVEINFSLALACGVFLTAGVLRLSRWRILGDARSAMMGSALVVMGGVSLPLGGIARLLDPDHVSMTGPLTRGAGSVVCMALVLRAILVCEVTDRERPGRLLPRSALLVSTLFAVLTLVQPLVPAVLHADLVQRDALACVLAAGWVTIGLLAVVRATEHPWNARVAPLILAMGAAEVFRAFDRGRAGVWLLAALVLTAAVAALAASCALSDLDDAVRVDQTRLADATDALDQARHEAGVHETWREEMTHDARNAFAGLRATLVLLERYGGRLDVGTIATLRRAAIDEVGHLEHLIVRSTVEPNQLFDVSAVVATVVETRRAIGTEISLLSGATCGYGRRGDVATAVQNLLVNAEAHAPGSPVTVDVVSDGRTVEVTVADRGPGLDAAAADHVFERGSRGPASSGSGLGLYLARSLMLAQHGDLQLRQRDGGATFVLSLPCRPAPAPARSVPRQRDEVAQAGVLR